MLNPDYQNKAAFENAFGPSLRPAATDKAPLHIDWTETPYGPMLSVADDEALYMLEFTARKNLGLQMHRLAKRTGRAISPGSSAVTRQINSELGAYFKGDLSEFRTPVAMPGTPFQIKTWEALQAIPAGETRSYKDLAKSVGSPKGFRAVAGANANNRLAIIVPCHRVISANGGLGGYAGGLDKKRALLTLEGAAI